MFFLGIRSNCFHAYSNNKKTLIGHVHIWNHPEVFNHDPIGSIGPQYGGHFLNSSKKTNRSRNL